MLSGTLRVHSALSRSASLKSVLVYRVYQNDWSGFEFDYIHKYGEQNYKY